MNWQPISTAPNFERVIVAGWQPARGRTKGYWWWHEDAVVAGRALEHPEATHWTLPNLPPFPDASK
jgi:hypothetical protein